MNWTKIAIQSKAELWLCRGLLPQSVICNLSWTNLKTPYRLHVNIRTPVCRLACTSATITHKSQEIMCGKDNEPHWLPSYHVCVCKQWFCKSVPGKLCFWRCISSFKVNCNSKVTPNHLNSASTHPPFFWREEKRFTWRWLGGRTCQPYRWKGGQGCCVKHMCGCL